MLAFNSRSTPTASSRARACVTAAILGHNHIDRDAYMINDNSLLCLISTTMNKAPTLTRECIP